MHRYSLHILQYYRDKVKINIISENYLYLLVVNRNGLARNNGKKRTKEPFFPELPSSLRYVRIPGTNISHYSLVIFLNLSL